MPGKHVQFDAETWAALDPRTRDRMMDQKQRANKHL
jgi:hypothetical protein